MSELARLASACIFPGFPGTEPPEWVRRELDHGLGGVVLFAWNVRDPEQLVDLAGALRAGRDDVIVAIDEEGGDVTRLEAEVGSSYPGNGALGRVDDPDLTRRVAAAMGRDLAAAGVNLDLAPVADVLSDPESPIIGLRSFGAEPALVARHVSAFVEGMQGSGVAACAKHFPGHGGTAEDSHRALPTVASTREELRARGLVPFRAAVDAGVAAILTAHIRVPEIDELPATLSAVHLEGLLRGELGFPGVIMTDALEMHAISRGVGVEEGGVQALVAGADALCLGHDLAEDAVARVRSAIVAAVESGRLAEDRLATAVGRLAHLASSFSDQGATTGTEHEIGLDAARRATHVEGAVALGEAALVVELVPEASIAAGHAPYGLGELVVSRLPGSSVLRIEGEPPPDLGPRLGSRPVVLVLRDAHRHAWQQNVAATIIARAPTVAIEVGLPLWKPEGARGYVATYGAGRANLTAAAELLTA